MKRTEDVEKAIRYAKRISKKLSQNYTGTEHLLIGLVHVQGNLAQVLLDENDVTEGRLIEMIDELISLGGDVGVMDRDGFTPKFVTVIRTAEEQALLCGMNEVGCEHILLGILRNPDCAAARLLSSLDIDMQQLFNDIIMAMGESGEHYRQEMMQQNRKRGSSSRSALEQFSDDLTKKAADGKLDPVIGRNEEISRVIQILSRRGKNNPCLIGEPGVGKTAIVEGLAERIASGMVPDSVAGKRVLTLDLAGMVAGTKYRGEFEERIKNVINEAVDDKSVLLFIDEIHTIIGAGGAEGSMDAANILKPAMSRGEIQIIGATTIDEYRKYIEKDAALERRFQPVTIEEPTVDETKEILRGIRKVYEDHHGITISDEALDACAELSERYISDRYLPDKAIDLMDESSARLRLNASNESDEIYSLQATLKDTDEEMEQALRKDDMTQAGILYGEREALKQSIESEQKKYQRRKNRKKLTLSSQDVADVVSTWTKIPVTKINESESHRLMGLEKTLHKRIVGQDEAVSAVARAVRRGRVGLKEEGRPIGSFLFLGPTGVGKTEVAKALAETVFGDEKDMIRVDMTEYMEKYSVSKMIGSPPGYVGYDEGGQLSEQVRRHPYSVVLFDEIEKADPDVFNVLLQVLDDGHITDSKGRKIDFKNTIIIMTSNAGAQEIMSPKKLGFEQDNSEQADYELMKSRVQEELKHIFKPEFLNRIDEQIVFRPLNKDDMVQITSIQMKDLIRRCREQMQIELSVPLSVKKLIVDQAYDPKFGARPLRRKIQTSMEDVLADELLSGKIKRGSKVEAGIKDGQIVFKVKKKK